MNALGGVRVALLEARRCGELATLVRRHGGDPYCVPALREQPVVDPPVVAAFLDDLSARLMPIVVLPTGVAVRLLFRSAGALGRGAELTEALRRATLVCRGPKPAAALRAEGLDANVRAPEPYTTAELIRVLRPLGLSGRDVTLVHHGERNLALVEALAGRGARLRELLLYEWRMPEDPGPLCLLVREIIQGRVGAMVFTCQAQVRHLFQIAAHLKRARTLAMAIQLRTVVAAVGPICARALEEVGVIPHVVPVRPKMGPVIEALAKHLARRGEAL